MMDYFRLVSVLFFLLCKSSLFAEQIRDKASSSISTQQKTTSISANPAAVNVATGSGILQKYVEKKFSIRDNHGLAFQGAWIGDGNRLVEGGLPQAKRQAYNSAGILDLTVDMAHFVGWQGGLFSAQFLQQNAENTNGPAGVVQGYNSLPDIPPYSRSELYALWYRQSFFADSLFLRIGKTITTLDFNNVVKPVQLSRGDPNIPAVTSLIYTPIFINPAVDGLMPGYTNTAYGLTATFAPQASWYGSYGVYDGNLAQGVQTGLTGPHFNGNYFQVGEMGSAWLLGHDHKPGTVGIGLWHQSGWVKENNLIERGATGTYLFGSQRLWYRHPGQDTSGISGFYQYGISNSHVLAMRQSIGAGLTAFGLMAGRTADSCGAGISLAWLNQRITNRKRELMMQVYYQAKVWQTVYLEPVISYIPNPGQNRTLYPATAGTLRAIVLF